MASRALGDGLYELIAGEHRVVVQAGGGQFESQPVRWELGQGDSSVFADAVFYSGEERVFRFSEIAEAWIAAGVQLLQAAEPAAEARVEVHPDCCSCVRAKWPIGDGLTIVAAGRPTP